MATTSPARIDDDLYASAKLAGDVQSRSAAQQVAHWARIGREIEASASISHKDIAEVLAGSRSYDALNAKEQAVVRAEWSARMEALRRPLDLAERFSAEGRSWVELDDEGTVSKRSGTKRDARRINTGADDGSVRDLQRTSSMKIATSKRADAPAKAGKVSPKRRTPRRPSD